MTFESAYRHMDMLGDKFGYHRRRKSKIRAIHLRKCK